MNNLLCSREQGLSSVRFEGPQKEPSPPGTMAAGLGAPGGRAGCVLRVTVPVVPAWGGCRACSLLSTPFLPPQEEPLDPCKVIFSSSPRKYVTMERTCGKYFGKTDTFEG